jgi:hypothetical protein
MATTINLPGSLAQAENFNTGERGGVAGAHEVPSGIASAARFWTNDVGTSSNNSDLSNIGSQSTAANENALFGGSNGFSFANSGGDIYAKNNPASTQSEVSNAVNELQNSIPTAARTEAPDISTPQMSRTETPDISAPQVARSETPEIATPASASTRNQAPEVSSAATTQGDGWVQIPTVPMWLVMGGMSPLSGYDTAQAFQQLTNTQYTAFIQDNPQCRPDVQQPQQDSNIQAMMGDEAYLHNQDSQAELQPEALGT